MFPLQQNKKIGFTLIELLVVISIIGMLSSIVLASLNSARDKAKVAKAKAELQTIYQGILLLDSDTRLRPGGYSSSLCAYTNTQPSWGNGLYISDANAGLINYTSSKFPGWKGPYLSTMVDPWGQEYIYDSYYTCNGGANNCSGGSYFTVIHSGGPNRSGINAYDIDNIALILCKH